MASRMDASGGEKQSAGPAPVTELVAPLLILTVLAAGGGILLGLYLPGGESVQATLDDKEAVVDAAPSKARRGHDADMRPEKGKETADALKKGAYVLKELAPIITNLADPPARWIRVQVSIVVDPKEVGHLDVLVAELTSDIVAYLRTMSLSAIEGTNGLRRLHEELLERAAVRSSGAVRELIIQSLVVQ